MLIQIGKTYRTTTGARVRALGARDVDGTRYVVGRMCGGLRAIWYDDGAYWRDRPSKLDLVAECEA